MQFKLVKDVLRTLISREAGMFVGTIALTSVVALAVQKTILYLTDWIFGIVTKKLSTSTISLIDHTPASSIGTFNAAEMAEILHDVSEIEEKASIVKPVARRASQPTEWKGPRFAFVDKEFQDRRNESLNLAYKKQE